VARYVYADAYFLINLLMNYVLLSASARLTGLSAAPRRLLLGALLGAIYSLGFLTKGAAWLYSPAVKVAVSVIMVGAVHWPVSFRTLLRQTAYLFALSFLAAGTMMAVSFLPVAAGGLEPHSVLSSWGVLVAVFVVAIMVRAGLCYLRQRTSDEQSSYDVDVCMGDRVAALRLLLDTGNRAYDPVSGKPVIVVETRYLHRLLPALAVPPGQEWDIWTRLGSVKGLRLLAVPFTSLGKRCGVMPAFLADRITVKKGDESRVFFDLPVALAPDRVCPDGTYHGLLHPDLLSGEVRQGG